MGIVNDIRFSHIQKQSTTQYALQAPIKKSALAPIQVCSNAVKVLSNFHSDVQRENIRNLNQITSF